MINGEEIEDVKGILNRATVAAFAKKFFALVKARAQATLLSRIKLFEKTKEAPMPN